MKNFFPSFTKLAAVAVCALSLGSCNRAEYAMLPKGGSYHGVTRFATPVHASTSSVVVQTPTPATEPVLAAPHKTEASPKPTEAQVAVPVQSASTVAKTGNAKPEVIKVETATVVTAPAPKLNLGQRLALGKVTRKVDKLMRNATTVRQHDNTAATAKGGISGNLRIGIILLLVGLLVGLLNGLIGTIIAIIGLIFIILWLLDQM